MTCRHYFGSYCMFSCDFDNPDGVPCEVCAMNLGCEDCAIPYSRPELSGVCPLDYVYAEAVPFYNRTKR